MMGKPGGDKRSCIVSGEGELPDYFMKTAKEAGIRVRSDRFPAERLFAHSDNFSFAGKKVPAHTFMMFLPGDPDYHQLSDEIGTLDLENMAAVVLGLIPGIEGLANGKFTPKRL